MYKAIVNIATKEAFWAGTGERWIPDVFPPGMEVVDCVGDIPDPTEHQKLEYDPTGPTVIVVDLPFLAYEGHDVRHKGDIKFLADRRLKSLFDASSSRGMLLLLRLWRASHIVANPADFGPAQVTAAETRVAKGLQLFNKMNTLLAEQAQAETDFDAL
jgi:hypothetical protein